MRTFYLEYSQPWLSVPDHSCIIWENKSRTFQLEDDASDADARDYVVEFLSQHVVEHGGKSYQRSLTRLQETPPRRTLWEHRGPPLSPEMREVAERFFATKSDPNWPSTPLQKRMQSSGG